MKPKILFLDIETAPSLAWVWGKYDQNVIAFEEDWYILSYAYKWLGSSQVIFRGLPDYPNYSRDKRNDKLLVTDLAALLDSADIVIAHNGDRFDTRKINGRLLFHKITPPSPYQTVDTLKIARSAFKLDGNALNDIVRYLKVGLKLPNTGWALWQGCMKGVKSSWKTMKEYNIHDINLLEIVYNQVRPWAKSHPNLCNLTGTDCCPVCASTRIQARGYSNTLVKPKQRWRCSDCGKWFLTILKKKS